VSAIFSAETRWLAELATWAGVEGAERSTKTADTSTSRAVRRAKRAARVTRAERAGLRKSQPAQGRRPEQDRLPAPSSRALGGFPFVNPQFLSRITKAPGVITGKPPELSGSEGREYATSFGGAVVIDEFVGQADVVDDDPTVAIQGFGNVGSHLARFLAERDYTVVAVSTAQGAIYDGSGIDVAGLFESSEGDEDLFEFGAERITNDELLTLTVDLLVPAAIEDQITGENVSEIQASAVVEMANGPTTPEADRRLAERGVPVVPDILANAGGVTGSYYEWVQNTTNEYWSERRVREKLEEHMRTAFADLREIRYQTGGTWREAAYTRAVDSVLEAEQYRSNLSR
jgi:glutamate dehydrogenase (NAD(P)+)